MSNDQIINLLIGYGFFTAGVWGITQALGTIPSIRTKFADRLPVLALLVGVLTYTPLAALGLLKIEGIPLWKNVLASIVFGAIAIGASAVINDKFVNPMRDLFRKSGDKQ